MLYKQEYCKIHDTMQTKVASESTSAHNFPSEKHHTSDIQAVFLHSLLSLKPDPYDSYIYPESLSTPAASPEITLKTSAA